MPLSLMSINTIDQRLNKLQMASGWQFEIYEPEKKASHELPVTFVKCLFGFVCVCVSACVCVFSQKPKEKLFLSTQ